MGEWVIGAFINLFGSIAINFGTNLLKLGHNQASRGRGFSMYKSNTECGRGLRCCSLSTIINCYPTRKIHSKHKFFTPYFVQGMHLSGMLRARIVVTSTFFGTSLYISDRVPPEQTHTGCKSDSFELEKRERLTLLENDGNNGKLISKPIIYFQTWRIGILFFALGNCLNFLSFGYAAQSLLAALGSVQFVSNICFAYFVLNKLVTVKVLVATAFIVIGNIFLVAFGNHQSPVYTTDQLAEKYSNIVFLLYCMILVVIVIFHHSIYRKGESLLSGSGHDLQSYWHTLLPFSYAMVSGAIGSCSVLFAKSLSNLLRLTMSSSYQLHSWFTYSMLLLFLSTAGFWMARLNEGLALFDAILIVPMFQIAWTFFSICTGFVYFQEYQVFDALRTTMFILGMTSVFIGISLLAPDESKGGEGRDPTSSISSPSPSVTNHVDRFIKIPSEEPETEELRSLGQAILKKVSALIVKAKNTCTLYLGFGEDTIGASSLFVMPMVSSRMTGFRGSGFTRSKFFSLKNAAWTQISIDQNDAEMLETSHMLSQDHD